MQFFSAGRFGVKYRAGRPMRGTRLSDATPTAQPRSRAQLAGKQARKTILLLKLYSNCVTILCTGETASESRAQLMENTAKKESCNKLFRTDI